MSRAIDEMRLRRSTYQREAFEAPWSVNHQNGACGIHIVLDGRASLRAEAASFRLAAGDLVILPRSLAHTLSSIERAPRGENSKMLSGLCEFDAPDHPLFSVLPPIIHATPARLQDNPRYGAYLENLKEEVLTARDGSDALAARLTEVLLIEVMRFFTPPPGVECPVGGWFSGLSDPALRRALVALHEDPSKNWTVDALAKVACESRSAFAAHFARVMREPPMAYLARWRMFRGRSLLRQTELSLDAIAERVGYGSAAAFSLAFTRTHGMSPGAYRRTNGEATPGFKIQGSVDHIVKLR